MHPHNLSMPLPCRCYMVGTHYVPCEWYPSEWEDPTEDMWWFLPWSIYIYISTHLLCFSFFFLYFPKGKRQPLDGIYIVGGGGGVQLSQLYHKIQLRLCHQHDPQFNQGGGQMVMLPLRESLVNWSQVWDPLSLVGKLPLCGLFGIR